MSHRVRVWDLPTRLFHWGLVISVAALFITGEIGGNAMAWHFQFGYTVLSLLLFRIVWGLIGGHWSRFASFLYSPATILGYIRGQTQPEHRVGHNPLGAGSVFAFLLALLAQVGTGLMSDDDIAASGPMARFVSDATVSMASWYHRQVGKTGLIVLVLLHLAAIGFYLVKRKVNLIPPMIHGDKYLPGNVTPSRDDARSRLVAAVVFAACVCSVWGMVYLAA
ncbi:MAG: hypothetical protein RIS34_1047 [Pseudomonadota bacterium]|jgi:cytochrome b